MTDVLATGIAKVMVRWIGPFPDLDGKITPQPWKRGPACGLHPSILLKLPLQFSVTPFRSGPTATIASDNHSQDGVTDANRVIPWSNIHIMLQITQVHERVSILDNINLHVSFIYFYDSFILLTVLSKCITKQGTS